MTFHPLDRPIWSALTSGWSAYAEGGPDALRIDARYNLFGAARDVSPAALAALAALVPASGELWAVEPGPVALPGARIVAEKSLDQMIAERPVSGPSIDCVALHESDGAAVRALVALTQPGPFASDTHRIGDFIGVKIDGALIAMAGERMRMPGLAEVSGVCTHPDHRGRGLAAALMRAVMQRIVARGETPFLHAYSGNRGAIGLYQSLGFEFRRTMIATVLVRAP